MAVKVSNVINNISGALKSKPVKVASKAMGVAALASVIYDAHVNGREKANVTEQIETGDRFYNQYSQYMTMEKESATIAKLKKTWFDMQQSMPLNHLWPRTKGYFSGFGGTIIKCIPEIGLSIAALKCKKIGVVAAALLAIEGIKTCMYDVMGIGARKADKS